TAFSPEGQRKASRIGGAQDDDVRTFAKNLTPMLSFRFVPAKDVAPGDEWSAQWNDSLGSRQGKEVGHVGSSVRYRLDRVESCGTSRCAHLTARGKDDISDNGDGVTGTSGLDGGIVVEVDGLRLVRKHVVSTADLTAKRGGSTLHAVTRTDVEAVLVAPCG